MTITCPIPQVDEALRPYIRTRQEALQIRQAISRELQQQVSTSALITHLSSLSIAEAPKAKNVTGSGDGPRRQYVEALSAHNRAKTAFSAVKSDLERLRKDEASPPVDTRTDNINELRNYASTVRQQKEKDKLEAVQRALTRLDGLEPHPAKVDVKSAVKERIGLPPDAPFSRTGDESVANKIDELTVALKKAIIQAKADLDTAKKDRARARELVEQRNDVRLDLRLAAFQAARQELIQWIESELTKVTDDDHDTDVTEHPDDKDYTEEEVQSLVADLYDGYVSARQTLVQKVETIFADAPKEQPQIESSEHISPSKANAAQHSPITASQLLSFLPALMQLSRDEAALLQQTAYVKRQINVGASETKQTIQRLAGESRLAPPDASSVTAWETATQEAAKETRSVVLDHVKSGAESLDRAKEVLAVLQARRTALEHLKGGS